MMIQIQRASEHRMPPLNLTFVESRE